MTVETGALTAAFVIGLYAWGGNVLDSGANFTLFVLHFSAPFTSKRCVMLIQGVFSWQDVFELVIGQS